MLGLVDSGNVCGKTVLTIAALYCWLAVIEITVVRSYRLGRSNVFVDLKVPRS